MSEEQPRPLARNGVLAIACGDLCRGALLYGDSIDPGQFGDGVMVTHVYPGANVDQSINVMLHTGHVHEYPTGILAYIAGPSPSFGTLCGIPRPRDTDPDGESGDYLDPEMYDGAEWFCARDQGHDGECGCWARWEVQPGGREQGVDGHA